jgi:hypothetical protein
MPNNYRVTPFTPFRRLKTLALLAAFIAVLADFSDAYAAGQPNILLIVADDMGFSDTSPYGGEIFTPNIASLAYQGAMFTNFHVAPTCTPTRAMLLTGRAITLLVLAT